MPPAPSSSRLPDSEVAASDGSGWSVELRRSHLIYGVGALGRLGELADELGGGPVLLVTDHGLRAAGWVDEAAASLRASGHSVTVFFDVHENPTERDVARGAEVCRESGSRLIVGLGGGSAMDCAKGINFIATQGGRMEDYWGFGKASAPMLPSIGVPCTAGTGSEAQSFALISRDEDHVKMACGDEKARFSRVVLDPQTVATAPQEVVAATAVDAVSHAVESMVSTSSNPLSRLYSREAFRLLDQRFDEVAAVGATPTVEALGDMLLGAHLAGAAIEMSMLGAAHACANPLTAAFDVTHGAAVGLVLPSVVRYNAASCEVEYGQLAGSPPGEAGEALASRLETMRRLAGLPETLEQVGVRDDQIDDLAAAAAPQWTAEHNPRKVAVPELTALYRSCLEKAAARR